MKPGFPVEVRRAPRFAWFAATTLLVCPPVFSAGDGSDATGAIETLVITAEKRAENPQNVPVSVQVIGSQTLNQQNLNSLESVAEVVPSVHINETGSGGQLFIRGVGSGTSLSFDQSVGTFIDDIYHGRAHTSGAIFLDLDRVEILKGPQSTFFGNNAIAGALNVVTTKPSNQFEGWARALYGEYGQYAAEGAVNIPIGPTLAVRVAGAFDGMDGWQKNTYAGFQGQNNEAGRVTALSRPNQDLDITLKLESTKNRDRAGSQIADCPPPAPFVAAGFCKTAISLGIPTGLDSDRNTTSAGQGVDLSTFESTLTANYRHWSHTLTSVTGFYEYHSQQNIDADGTPSTLLNLQIEEQFHQFSQEFRVASPNDQAIQYLLGAYFQTDRIDGRGVDLTYDFLDTTIKAKPSLARLVPYLPLASSSDNYIQSENAYALFGSVSWDLTDRLKLSGGLRGSWVDKEAGLSGFYGTGTQAYGGITPLPANLQPLATSVLGAQTPGSGNRSDSKWIPSASTQYRLDTAAMVYFSYSEGFKAGVPTGGVINGVPVPPILPEHVKAYEFGLKSKWFDRRVLLNIDAFRSNYSDLQVTSAIFTSLGVPIIVTTNAASSRSQGIEFEGKWAVDGHFTLSSALTYLDSRYISYPNVTLTGLQTFCRGHIALPACASRFPHGVPALQDLSGRPTSFAPLWSGSVTGSYGTNLFREYHLSAQTSALFSSSYYYANNGTDDDLLRQATYLRMDAQLSLESPERQWSVDLIGKNLTDRVIVAGGTGGTSLPTSLGSTLLRKEQPRNLAVQFRYQW